MGCWYMLPSRRIGKVERDEILLWIIIIIIATYVFWQEKYNYDMQPMNNSVESKY